MDGFFVLGLVFVTTLVSPPPFWPPPSSSPLLPFGSLMPFGTPARGLTQPGQAKLYHDPIISAISIILEEEIYMIVKWRNLEIAKKRVWRRIRRGKLAIKKGPVGGTGPFSVAPLRYREGRLCGDYTAFLCHFSTVAVMWVLMGSNASWATLVASSPTLMLWSSKPS